MRRRSPCFENGSSWQFSTENRCPERPLETNLHVARLQRSYDLDKQRETNLSLPPQDHPTAVFRHFPPPNPRSPAQQSTLNVEPCENPARLQRESGRDLARFQRRKKAVSPGDNHMLHLRHEDDHLTPIRTRILAVGPERHRNGPRALPYARAARNRAAISRHTRSSTRLERNPVLACPRSRASRPSKQRRTYGSSNAMLAKRVVARTYASWIRRTSPRHKS